MKAEKHFWAVSDAPLSITNVTDITQIRAGRWYFYSDMYPESNEEIRVLVLGYVLPRLGYASEYHNAVNAALILQAYKKHGDSFTEHIKGMFTAIIIKNNEINIFCDRTGMGKYFIYRSDSMTTIASSTDIIANNFHLNVSHENIAIYNLMEHFIDNRTMFRNLTYSKPGSQVRLFDGIHESQYWERDSLLFSKKTQTSFSDFAARFREIIKGYLTCFRPISTTITLTGGNDSRAILAALLNIGTTPRAFTFGNPKSYDGVVAAKIAQTLTLEHNFYFEENPSVEWYTQKTAEITRTGNSIINIHRAHRLDAIQKEKRKYSETDMLFVGLMGGEYIKGIVYDDYITSKFYRLAQHGVGNMSMNIDKILGQFFQKTDSLNKSTIIEILNRQDYFSYRKKIDREFAFVFDVVGSVHHYQDTKIFCNYVPVVVNIFQDIDFLQMLFSSQYSMLFKDNSSKNQLKRIDQPALHCNMINMLAPSLNTIEFAKGYSPREFLGNRFVYIAKRMYRNYFGRTYPENFPYGSWFREYIESRVESVPSIAHDVYDVKKYKNSLREAESYPMEKQWHRYSNFVNIIENMKIYT